MEAYFQSNPGLLTVSEILFPKLNSSYPEFPEKKKIVGFFFSFPNCEEEGDIDSNNILKTGTEELGLRVS